MSTELGTTLINAFCKGEVRAPACGGLQQAEGILHSMMVRTPVHCSQGGDNSMHLPLQLSKVLCVSRLCARVSPPFAGCANRSTLHRVRRGRRTLSLSIRCLRHTGSSATPTPACVPCDCRCLHMQHACAVRGHFGKARHDALGCCPALLVLAPRTWLGYMIPYGYSPIYPMNVWDHIAATCGLGM